MSLDPASGYRALRAGRYSEPGREYFVTFCTAERQHGLTSAEIGQALLRHLASAETDGVWTVRCATVMPDHVHLLIALGERLPLGKAVARLKAKTAPALRDAGLQWQSGYFEHYVRPEEERLPYFLCTYLNPYREKLIALDREWPWFECGEEDRAWFFRF